jgi:hypothetical protein
LGHAAADASEDAAIARLPAKKKRKARKTLSPGDYEAELVRLCKGNRTEAERLILDELQRSPTLSRQGAALAVVTRLRHEHTPTRRTL